MKVDFKIGLNFGCCSIILRAYAISWVKEMKHIGFCLLAVTKPQQPMRHKCQAFLRGFPFGAKTRNPISLSKASTRQDCLSHKGQLTFIIAVNVNSIEWVPQQIWPA